MLKGLAGFDNSLFGIRTWMASGRMPGSILKAWQSWDLRVWSVEGGTVGFSDAVGVRRV